MNRTRKQFDESVEPDFFNSITSLDDLLNRANLPKDQYKNRYILNAASLIQESFKPMQWAVRDFLPAGCVLFAGRPKLGKSWFAYQIAIAIASGGMALGHIPVKQGDVLYLALEDGRQRLQWRLQALLKNGQAPQS